MCIPLNPLKSSGAEVGLHFMDEATSNMDCDRAGEVVDNIFKLSIPCIIVPHDKKIIEKADEVICL